MAYEPTVWVDEDGSGNGTVVTAARMNKIEQGIAEASATGVPDSAYRIPEDEAWEIPDGRYLFMYGDLRVRGHLILHGRLKEISG